MIATWNVRTLTDLSISNEMKRYKMDILGLSTIRWLGQGEHFMQDGSLFAAQINKLEDKHCFFAMLLLRQMMM